MNILNTLGLILGTGYSSGLNLYASILTLGLLQRFDVIHLPSGLQILSNPTILGIAAVLYLIEFFADKIPYLDSIWDSIHTLSARLRPPFSPTLPPECSRPGMALGRSPARRQRRASSTARKLPRAPRPTPAPSPSAIGSLSFGEDFLPSWLTWMASAHPLRHDRGRGRSAAAFRVPDLSSFSLCPPRVSTMSHRLSTQRAIDALFQILCQPPQKRLVPKLRVLRLQHPVPLVRKHHQL